MTREEMILDNNRKLTNLYQEKNNMSEELNKFEKSPERIAIEGKLTKANDFDVLLKMYERNKHNYYCREIQEHENKINLLYKSLNEMKSPEEKTLKSNLDKVIFSIEIREIINRHFTNELNIDSNDFIKHGSSYKNIIKIYFAIIDSEDKKLIEAICPLDLQDPWEAEILREIQEHFQQMDEKENMLIKN